MFSARTHSQAQQWVLVCVCMHRSSIIFVLMINDVRMQVMADTLNLSLCLFSVLSVCVFSLIFSFSPFVSFFGFNAGICCFLVENFFFLSFRHTRTHSTTKMWPEQLISMADTCMRLWVSVCMWVCAAIHARQLNVNDDVFMVVFWQFEYSVLPFTQHCLSIFLAAVAVVAFAFAVHLLLFFTLRWHLWVCVCLLRYGRCVWYSVKEWVSVCVPFGAFTNSA